MPQIGANFLPTFPPVGQPNVQPSGSQWQPYEKEFLRMLCGVPLLYTNFQPRFESAILTVQTVANGGSLPDSSVVDAIRNTMFNIGQVDANLQNAANFGMAIAVDKKDIVTNFSLYRFENIRLGRQYVAFVMTQLGLTSAFRDYFTGAQLLESWEDMFISNKAEGL